MRLSSLLIVFATFATAALLSLVTASLSADLIEDSAERSVKRDLDDKGMQWAEVYAEGLQVFLAGIAPSEAERFRAISSAGGIVDAARVIDNMQVEATADIAPPRFSIEILRNDAGISLIGLIPETSDRGAIVDKMIEIAGRPNVTDLLETAEYDAPDGWPDALTFALRALDDLPRAKISVQSGAVSITAMADSPEDRRDLESALLRGTPKDMRLDLNISAPRPVITPFTLRFVIDDNGPRFDACSADTERTRVRILTAANAAGLEGGAVCTLGLGVPTPRWADAVEIGLKGLAELGGGTITFSDSEVTLVAQLGTDQALFDKVVGELESGLPQVFALHSTLPAPIEEDDTESTIPEFIATLSPEGLVQLRGRLPNDLARNTTASYARARFGGNAVHMAARLDDTLPASWPVRVMAGLDALARLHNGVLNITPDSMSIAGRTGNTDANAEIARLLSEKLSQTDQYAIDVIYVEELDPLAALPTPEECIAALQSIQNDQKIVFEPGSGTLDPSAKPIIDAIAARLQECPDLRVEIQGHTDSQGRESMNQALSQTRAQAVLNALQDRRILTSGITATGYGESQPIADNDTADGREANRRIEFVLIGPEKGPQQATEAATEGATDATADDAGSAEEAAADPDATTPDTEEEAAASDADDGDQPQDNAETTGEETTPNDTN
ncbi:OmpA family protein [Shimia abyssi]|uniref:OOP family OmpA-OmpF porin n=1 Tax=Shimia abyssi TaxID=1662395 RepID=A0A2P8FB25_9RHOB|nr:OmpA family protein [Shimia abyssi]PSL18909.1 OOP family OmpA-OmpF porin [Shimia abyssi]